MGISEVGLSKPCSVRRVTGIVKLSRGPGGLADVAPTNNHRPVIEPKADSVIGLAGSEVPDKVDVGGQQ